MKNRRWLKQGISIAISLLAVAFLSFSYLFNKIPLTVFQVIAGWLAFTLVAFIGVLGMPRLLVGKKLVAPWLFVLMLAAAVCAGFFYMIKPTTAGAWGFVVAVALLLLWVETLIGYGWRLPLRLLLSLVTAGVFGLLLAGLWMIESRFSEEEFFVAVQAVILAVLWWALWWIVFAGGKDIKLPEWARRGIAINRVIVTVAFSAVFLAFVFIVINRYQASFYPQTAGAPVKGISASQPLLCNQTPGASTRYGGKETWQEYLDLVAQNPNAGPAEYGMLALGTGSQEWAVKFHDGLLKEASAAEYTGPANSVKIGQYYAALLAYYYPKVRDVFPNLFSQAEEKQIQNWFGKINRRALTVEWVDWMYSLAFVMRPEGPYENQENGAGLLAILKTSGLEDPALARANADYLARNPRGWLQRFRNTDDAIMYQPLWITNAYLQSLYFGKVDEEKERLAFEWLLAQALPNGDNLQYNHPESTSFVGTAYLGAVLLHDARYLWLAGKGIETLKERGGYLEAQPGIEQPVTFDGVSPQIGSCLIYGDSGLPNQLGPLAPDKLVIRNGWENDSLYMLLNLRFTGWHRYKATNTVTLLYHQLPSVTDNNNGATVAWLPYGRSHFRDKRIPRENLNGLSIERTGLSRVLFTLTGIGGPWEQDPPFYAQATALQVKTLKEEGALNQANVTISDWHGWRQEREINWTNDGLIAVVDRVHSPANAKGSLFWHVNGTVEAPERIRLGNTGNDEMMLIPSADNRLDIQSYSAGTEGGPDLTIQYRLPETGESQLVSVFLTGRWSGSTANIENRDGRSFLHVFSQDRSVEIPLRNMEEASKQ